MYWNNTFVNLTCMVAWMMHLFITVFSSSHASLLWSSQYNICHLLNELLLQLTQRRRRKSGYSRQQAAEDEVLSRLNKLLQRMMRLSHWWKLLLRTIEGNVVFSVLVFKKIIFYNLFYFRCCRRCNLAAYYAWYAWWCANVIGNTLLQLHLMSPKNKKNLSQKASTVSGFTILRFSDFDGRGSAALQRVPRSVA